MPNTLTIVFTSTPSNQPVEFQNPNSPGVYVTGIQQTNGTWQVIFTGVTKGTYGALTARLKNFPAISATIGASAAVLNIVPLAPTGTSATGISNGTSTGISVTASTSPNGLINRILASATSGGTFAQIYQGSASSYTHLLAGGTVQYYQYQYVGNGGFYDDSPLSLAFMGTASAAATALVVTATNIAYNSRSIANNGGTQYDALAEFTILTDSANLTVNAYGFNESGYPTIIADVWVNGVEFAGGVPGVIATGTTGAATFQLTGLPITAGTPLNVKFTMGGQQNLMGTRPFNTYVSLTSVIVPSGFSGSILTPVVHPAELIYVYGDSTTQYNCAFSWGKVLNRNYRPNSDIFVTGAGALVGGVFISDATKQAALLADYKATRNQGSYAKGKFWFDSMVNDCYFNSYTPSQLNTFYTQFAQMFLADTTISSDMLYFKSAIPTTSHNNAGPNGLGYPLYAYRDAMSAAVSFINSARVRYADGTLLQDAQYLVDGTHVNRAGDAYAALNINTFLNQSSSVVVGTLTSITAVQTAPTIFLSTDSTSAVEYSMELNSGSGTYGAWQTGASYETPTAGTRTFRARLQATPTTVVTTTKVIDKVMFANSAELTKVGTGWTNQNNSTTPTRGAFTTTAGDYYTWTDVCTGFNIWQNRQENCPTIVVSVDGGPGVTTNISGPGYNYVPQLVYSVTGLTAGSHTIKVTGGNSSVMNIYGTELLGNPNAPVVGGPAYTITGVQKAIITVFATAGYGTSARVLTVTPSTTDTLEYSLDAAVWQASNSLSLEAIDTTAPLQSFYARRSSAPGVVTSGQLQLMPFYRAESAGGFTTESVAGGTGWAASAPGYAFPYWYNGGNTTEALIITLLAGEKAEIWARQQSNITQMDIIAFGGTRTTFATGGYSYDSNIGLIYTSVAAPVGGGTIKIYKNANQPAGLVSYFRRIKP